MKIELRNDQKCLASREDAERLVTSIGEEISGIDLTFDFSGIDVVAQAYLNELFLQLARRGFVLSEITYEGFNSPIVREQLEKELNRVVSLLTVE